MTESPPADRPLPAPWDHAARTRLEPDERVEAWLETDLNPKLLYEKGLVLLTDRRLLAATPMGNAIDWQSWSPASALELRTDEHGSAGSLDLLGPDGRLVTWRFTASRAAAAGRLAQRWAALAGKQGGASADGAVCPGCGAGMAPGEVRCPSCSVEPAPASAASLFRLFAFARPHLRLILLGFAITLASTTAGLIPPYLTMPLLDRVLIPHQNGQPVDFSLAAWYLAGLTGAALLAWLLDWARLYVLARAGERVTGDLRARTYAHLQRLSLEFFGGKRTGDLMARIGSDTERLCNFLSLNLVDFASDVLMIGMTATVLAALDWRLSLAALCPFPLIVWLAYRVRGRLLSGYRQAGAAWGELTSVLADTIPGIRVVKAFAQEQREIDRFGRSNARVFSANDRLNRIWSLFGPTVTLMTAGGLLVVWAFACGRVYHHAVTVGVLTAFLAYMARFYTRVESMIRMASSVQRASASAQRIFEILDRVPSVPEPARPVEPGRLGGEVEVRGVRFKYGTREVLHGIDLRVAPGEMVGIVGPSGAGKTTLVNLVCRFFDPSAGAILADGTDIRSFPVEAYRKNIGIVLQDPFLFYGTIADNIAYGKPGATREEVVAAARAARAHEFILRLPNGYDSLVGERGQSLSGGERQRISIARALLIDPSILILDEATSSVDTETEREIQAALEVLVRGRTTIAIAHRLSTLRRANRLIVLERGRVVESGPHDELLRADGVYARLHRAQAEAHGQEFVAAEVKSALLPEPSANGHHKPAAPAAGPPPLDPASLRLTVDAWGRLLAESTGRRHVGVEAIRAFPFSAPRQGVSICDAEGRELCWLADLDSLGDALRGAVEQRLASREFAPVIQRVRSISSAVEPSEWEVDTDRGPTRFILKSEDEVHHLGACGVTVTDSDGVRYRIPDPRELDAGSRRLLERFL